MNYHDNVHTPGETVEGWEKALKYLQDGNRRYVENTPVDYNVLRPDRGVHYLGQNPFAVIVTCSDSRTAPEIYFDQNMGDIFVVRVAGNIADSSVLASVEYAAGHLKTPLVAVVGHNQCGAVAGALEGGDYTGNLGFTINKIKSAITGCADFENAIQTNVKQVVAEIRKCLSVGAEHVKVEGAYYDIATGVVDWLNC